MQFQTLKTLQQAKQNTLAGYIQLCEPAFVISDSYKLRTGNPQGWSKNNHVLLFALGDFGEIGGSGFPFFPQRAAQSNS